MRRILGLAVGVLALFTRGLNQDVHPITRSTLVTPVTCGEAHSSFQRLEEAMAKTVGAKKPGPPLVPSGPKVVSRSQVVSELNRLSKLFASHYTLKPRAQYCDERVIKLPKVARSEAIRLIKLGFMEPVAPLAVGPKDSLTVQQFSEALGFFLARWADVTHLPSIKFSPGLMPDGSKPPPPAGSRVPTP